MSAPKSRQPRTASEPVPAPALCRFVPDASLRRFVDHYWLARASAAREYEILPDGAVDLVLAVGGARSVVAAYGTTTRATCVPLAPGGHYLGIRFRPGRSRHFLDVSARELTDTVAPLTGPLAAALERALDQGAQGDPLPAVDDALGRWVQRTGVERASLDELIDVLGADDGRPSLFEAAATLGRGPRQFERRFLDAVGLSPRAFAAVCRFQRAAAMLADAGAPGLAQVAAACGYADQSHMTRAFQRWAGRSPGHFRRTRVAFVQDRVATTADTATSCNQQRESRHEAMVRHRHGQGGAIA